ncbi:MAG: hypothetical protein KDF59_12755 [Nitrosomonas sp.]|nr:hypothetical protein [Nitrosomonas sp.]
MSSLLKNPIFWRFILLTVFAAIVINFVFKLLFPGISFEQLEYTVWLIAIVIAIVVEVSLLFYRKARTHPTPNQ